MIKLSKDESECPICKIKLERVADRTEIIKNKDIDSLDSDKILSINYTEKPCYCWSCPNCNLEMTITK